jgi:hypothetical protein
MGTLPGKSTQSVEDLKAFKDPLGNFPRWYDETDVSKIAREETWKDHQSYADRYVSRVTEVEQATAPLLNTITSDTTAEERQTWDEPEPRDGQPGLYPYVHTYESESGIVKEFDDTPNASRIVEYHPAGSFYEIYPDGKKMTKVVGDNYEIIIKNDNILIRGNSTITVEGNSKQLIKGDYDVEVVGDYNLKVHGNRNTKITKNDSIEIVGNFDKNVKENMIQRIGVDQTLLVDGNKTETIGGTSSLMVTGIADEVFLDTLSIFSNGAQSMSTNSTQQFLSKDGLEFGSQSDWNLKCNANMTIETVGTLGIQAGGNFTAVAPRIDLN